MKPILIAALTLAAAPALASDQLARSLGVEPGTYTLEQLVAIKAASTAESNDGRVNLQNLSGGVTRGASSPVINAPAAGN